MARRYQTVRGVARPKRQTEWFGSSVETAFTALAANTQSFDQELTGGLTSRPFTIVRTRGSIFIESDQEVAEEAPFGAFGMAVVSEEAAAAGGASLPQAYSNASSDLWFVHGYYAVNRAADGGAPYGNSGWEFQFDSKAMRKVADGSTIVVLVDNNSAAFGLNYLINFRLLIKLH